MDLHLHSCFDFDGILKRAGRNRDSFATDHTAPTLDIYLFIRSVTIHVATEIEPATIKLLK
jgi:hypothetical protein